MIVCLFACLFVCLFVVLSWDFGSVVLPLLLIQWQTCRQEIGCCPEKILYLVLQYLFAVCCFLIHLLVPHFDDNEIKFSGQEKQLTSS